MVSLIANGTPGNNITIDSQGPATHTLNKIWWGTIQVNYCTITRSTAVQTLTWYANNSIDGGSNTNWIFWPAPGNFTPKVIAIV
jgi:L-ascorbate metabolism protein UlaG (beta-lactamase superfamily)